MGDRTRELQNPFVIADASCASYRPNTIARIERRGAPGSMPTLHSIDFLWLGGALKSWRRFAGAKGRSRQWTYRGFARF